MIPSMIVGIGSDVDGSTLTCAVAGSMRSPKRITTVPRSNGPTTAEVTLTSENGSPW
jgi:hypothetical protein